MCSLCTPQCVLQPPFFKHLIVSPPISGFWAAGAFGPSSCVWCSHVFGHKVSVPMHCAIPCLHALCPCTVPMCPCTVPYPVPMHCAHAWNLGLSSLQRLLQSLLLLPQGLPQGPVRLTTAGQLWLQIRATGSAAHPPSTQSDGSGKPVCIHLLPASFACVVKTIFLHRTSDKNCKKKWVLELNRFVGFLRFGRFVLLTCWGFWLLSHRQLFSDQVIYHWTTG